MKDLHDIFLERLDSLTLQSGFRKKEAGTPFRELSQTDKSDYLEEKAGISKYTSDRWFRSTYRTVPKADSLLSIAKHFHVSVDYLLGNADSEEDYTEQYIHNYTGLNYESIAMLQKWKKMDDTELKHPLHAQKMQSIRALNAILSDQYKQEQEGHNVYDALHFIDSYLIADKIVRERGYVRFKSGNEYLKLDEGDIVTKADTGHAFTVDRPIITENITNNNKRIGVYEEGSEANCYYASLSDLYKAHSLKLIGEVLDGMIKRKETI